MLLILYFIFFSEIKFTESGVNIEKKEKKITFKASPKTDLTSTFYRRNYLISGTTLRKWRHQFELRYLRSFPMR